ncbi:MAG TPA: hypothetical protein VHU23_07840 [Rhizomicrobium sp.]|jgi:hypothetical protein|nr:hypothetical protein [Rhizomicrobium sp.]
MTNMVLLMFVTFGRQREQAETIRGCAGVTDRVLRLAQHEGSFVFSSINAALHLPMPGGRSTHDADATSARKRNEAVPNSLVQGISEGNFEKILQRVENAGLYLTILCLDPVDQGNRQGRVTNRRHARNEEAGPGTGDVLREYSRQTHAVLEGDQMSKWEHITFSGNI